MLKRIHQGMKLARFGIGKGFASLFSLSAHNRNVRILEALVNLEVREGETPGFTLSDSNAVLTVRRNPSSTAGTGNVNYRGTWDAATAYLAGDMVRKRSGTMQGVYIATAYSAIGTTPTYPETAPWDLICFAPIEYEETANDIDGEVETIYINASDRL